MQMYYFKFNSYKVQKYAFLLVETTYTMKCLTAGKTHKSLVSRN
jgi:hypothetical protein